MKQTLLQKIQQYIKEAKQRKAWQHVVRVLGCAVVFCTTYALILPAITMETATFCGLEEHIHAESCYAQPAQTLSLICTQQGYGDAEIILHTHNDLCYDASGELICSLTETEAHTHGDSCYTTVEVQQTENQQTEIHTHTDSCYTVTQGKLLCTKAEAEGHSHSDSCYTIGAQPVCGIEEGQGHIHFDSCYAEVTICTVPESEPHTHSESCCDENGVVICIIAEGEGHKHGEGCAEKQLVCSTEETAGHSHNEQCYEKQLACTETGTEDHKHTETCYEQIKTLICTQPDQTPAPETEKQLVCTKAEIAVHTHGASCYADGVLSCGSKQTAEHHHSESCVQLQQAEKTPICGETESETHTHGENCYAAAQNCTKAEHTHSAACYADPSADIETAENWEVAFENIEFTGDYPADLVAVAQTQLGYTESRVNYIVADDGTIKGYSRYGQWYGDKYADWNTLFLSFCANYAQIPLESWPQAADSLSLITALQSEEYNLYKSAADGYTPQVGDVVFIDSDADLISDRVGIVAEIIEETAETPAQIKTIEGDCAGTVQYVTYAADDAAIVGYGAVPRLTEEQKEINRVIELIDALPTCEEIEEKMAGYEAAEDYGGLEIWYTEVVEQVKYAYRAFMALDEAQREQVTNADKLMDLEFIWSAAVLIEDITTINSAEPTATWYTSTKDFVELNLYDYNYYINNPWLSNNKYPGFQWNGGAYGYSSYMSTNSSADLGIPNKTTNRHYVDSIDFGNSIIADFDYATPSSGAYGKSATSISVGRLYSNSNAENTGKINWLWRDGSDNATITNRPVGMSTGYQSLSNVLIDGYPALSDGTSLKYLFAEGESVTKQNNSSIDGLFQRDETSGQYRYNSRTNHAQYDTDDVDGDGITDEFILYNQIITPNFIVYPFGNFLPMNSITNKADATQVGAFNYSGGVEDYVDGITADLDEWMYNNNGKWGYASRSQLKTMLQEYEENWNIDPRTINGVANRWSNLSAANAIKDYFLGDNSGQGDTPSPNLGFVTQAHLNNMYNIDWDVATNFFFGMDMKMNFMMPKDGMTGNDTNGDGAADYPMVFGFTGDDDVWVYIDGVLFLDLTGIHRHVGGKIDFVNGKVYYYELRPGEDGDVANSENMEDTISGTPYKTYTFAEILAAAGKDTSVLNSKGTFKDYTTHDFNFYYMERGSGSSVCRMNFNFPLLKKNSITVTKENEPDANVDLAGNPDYSFNIVTPDNDLFVGKNSVTGVTEYTVLDSAGNFVETREVDKYGIFTLKAGQSALFEGVEENKGKFYVQELIREEDNSQYGKVKVNGVESRYNELIDWSYRPYFTDSDNDKNTGPYGYKWYGRSGYDTDSSTNSTFYFEAQNGVLADKLTDLAITKNVLDYTYSRAVTYYNMHVVLDEKPLAAGTSYKVYDPDGNYIETRTVPKGNMGVISIANGETAVIENLLSDTNFTVWESHDSALGYTVAYDAAGANLSDKKVENGKISGVVHAKDENNTTVTITVTNSEKGAFAEIVGNKTMAMTDGTSRDYTFAFVEVTDRTGATVVDGTTREETISVTDTNQFTFRLDYIQAEDKARIPGKFYYRITENPADGILPNNTAYIAEVNVTEENVTNFTEAEVRMWKGTMVDGVPANLTEVLVANGEKPTADFVNTLAGDLVISKVVNSQSGMDYGKGFTFDVTLGVGTSNTALPTEFDAVITTVADGTAATQNIVVTTVDGKLVVKGDGTTTPITLAHNQTIEIKGIPYGATWTVAETNGDGYTIEHSINGGETAYGAATNGSVQVGDNTVAYTNVGGYILPETGGAGINTYIMAGLLLVLGSLAGLIYKKLRKEVSC